MSDFPSPRPMTPEDLKEFWLEDSVLLTSRWEHNIIVSPDGGLIGYASFDPDEQALHRLYVIMRYRRKGVATALMNSFSVKVKKSYVKPLDVAAKAFNAKMKPK